MGGLLLLLIGRARTSSTSLERCGSRAACKTRSASSRSRSGVGREALEIVRRLGDERGIAILLHRFSNTAIRRGDVALREFAEESLDAHHRAGSFPKGEAQALSSLAWVARQEGDLERALELLGESGRAARGRLPLVGGRHAREHRAKSLSSSGGSTKRGRACNERSRCRRDERSVRCRVRAPAARAHRSSRRRHAAGRVLLGATEAEHERAPVGPWIHGSSSASRLPPVENPELEAGTRGGAATLARRGRRAARSKARPRYLTRSAAVNGPEMRPYSRKTIEPGLGLGDTQLRRVLRTGHLRDEPRARSSRSGARIAPLAA